MDVDAVQGLLLKMTRGQAKPRILRGEVRLAKLSNRAGRAVLQVPAPIRT